MVLPLSKLLTWMGITYSSIYIFFLSLFRESNLKIRRCIGKDFNEYRGRFFKEEFSQEFSGTIQCESPTPDFYKFSGNFLHHEISPNLEISEKIIFAKTENSPNNSIPLSIENLLLRVKKIFFEPTFFSFKGLKVT
jgi:hypothetical protein